MSELDTMETFDFPVDPSTLPTTTQLPVGDVLLQIKKVERKLTKPSDGSINPKTGRPKVGEKACVNVQFSLYEPEELRGIPHTKMFILGSDEDPKAQKPMTWTRNSNLLMSMFKEAKVGGKTMAEYEAAAIDAIVGADVRVERSKDPRYDDKHTPKAFWEPGKKPVKVVDQQATMNAELDTVFGPVPAFDLKD